MTGKLSKESKGELETHRPGLSGREVQEELPEVDFHGGCVRASCVLMEISKKKTVEEAGK